MNNTFISTEIPVSITLKLPRIEVLDVLRGFSLLGIFLMNIEYFNRPLQALGEGIPAGTIGLDYVVARLTEIFVTGKFWVLFSMLFGMGFVVMQTQAALDGRPFKTIYLRRTIALLIFGLMHIAFLWSGDILHSYALVAFVLIWMPIMSIRATAYIGTMLYLGPACLLLLSSATLQLLSKSELKKIAMESADNMAAANEAAKIYSGGDYWQAVSQRWQDFTQMLDYEIYVFISALGIFMIGAAIMRSGRLLNLIANRGFFLKSMWVCGVVALGFIGSAQLVHGYDAMTSRGMLEQALMTIGNLPLSLFYLCTIAYAMSFSSASQLLGYLAPAGKMALTNYLMQSLIASSVFFGYGLGFWGQWGRVELALFVIMIFIVQLVFSNLWLRFFHLGPMEWLWRALTYGTLPTMRIDAGKSSLN
jgi:uncharacterized protein